MPRSTTSRRSLEELDRDRGTMGNHAFYLSIPPKSFPQVTEQLLRSGLAEQRDGQWRRVVIEKPFGSDLKTARELNDVVESVFPPDSVFRIDHYLGKETVQNILALRFANQLYEPIWNANYVDHVQITMAEDIGVGGRAGYYDGIGAARDVIQNHLLQLLALTAMEEPVSFDAADLRAEKEKVLSAVHLPEDLATVTARGQYAGGWQGGEKVLGFLEEDGMNPKSVTETYAAMRLDIDTRRWAGVPFYLRAGKRLGRRVTEIAVVFKRAPQYLFADSQTSALGQNALVIRVQPDEGVTIRFGSKVPGAGMQVRDVTMDFGYGHAFTEASPEAYERLILDVLLGDPPLFPRHQEVELTLEDPRPDRGVLGDTRAARTVPPGTWGPSVGRRASGPRRPRLEAAVIVELPDTTTNAVSKALVKIREEGGAVALGRVLTLVIATLLGDEEEAIEAANDASREHPMRVIVRLEHADGRPALKPGSTPRSASAETPARARSSSCARTATRRPTRRASSPASCSRTPPSSSGGRERSRESQPLARPHGAPPHHRRLGAAATRGALHALESQSQPRPVTPTSPGRGLTLWRAQLAAVLDQPPYEPVTGVQVTGAIDSPSTALLAAWLQLQLHPTTSCSRRSRRHAAASTACGWSVRAAPSNSSATSPASPRFASPSSRRTTSRSPGETSATASPTNSAASIPTSCTVR